MKSKDLFYPSKISVTILNSWMCKFILVLKSFLNSFIWDMQMQERIWGIWTSVLNWIAFCLVEQDNCSMMY